MDDKLIRVSEPYHNLLDRIKLKTGAGKKGATQTAIEKYAMEILEMTEGEVRMIIEGGTE